MNPGLICVNLRASAAGKVLKKSFSLEPSDATSVKAITVVSFPISG